MIVNIGCVTAEWLEIIGGSLCAVYACRRPLMCQLFYVYTARRGHFAQDILRMSKMPMRELVINIISLPLLSTNLRASGSSNVYCVDASSTHKASISKPVLEHVSRE